MQERDFRSPVSRAAVSSILLGKVKEPRQIEGGHSIQVNDDGKTYQWSILLSKEGYEFAVKENVYPTRTGEPPSHLLSADKGRGWWFSGEKGDNVRLAQSPTTCALAAAAADASFPARGVAEFVSRWGFFDPNPFLLRRDWTGLDSSKFDPYGRNLAERLFF